MQEEWTEEMWEVFEVWEKFTASFTGTETVPKSSVWYPSHQYGTQVISISESSLACSLHTVSELLFHIILKAKC